MTGKLTQAHFDLASLRIDWSKQSVSHPVLEKVDLHRPTSIPPN